MNFEITKYITKGIKEDNLMVNRHYDYCKRKEVPFVMILRDGSFCTIEVNISMWSELLENNIKLLLKKKFYNMSSRDLPIFNNMKITLKLEDLIACSEKSLYCLTGQFKRGEDIVIAEWLYDLYFEAVNNFKNGSSEEI
ncbi:MAG: hypothetical protein QXG00_07300 [Candidatus Woesearchaeota archaeon]